LTDIVVVIGVIIVITVIVADIKINNTCFTIVHPTLITVVAIFATPTGKNKLDRDGPYFVDVPVMAIWLVVWNMNFMTFHMLGMSSSQLTNSYFSRGVGQPPTGYIVS